MSDLVTVQAGWAVWSKHPGTRDDYAVLYSSAGPLSAAEFSSVLAHFAPGNPPAGSGTPSSLPWVTLNRVGVADKTYMGVSAQVPTEHVDATGRPVSRTSYLCVPYDDLASGPVSYGAMSEALAGTQLPYPNGALVPLTLPRLDAAALARSILEFGPDIVATTAALLLSGPVTVTVSGSDFPGVETRVRFLDAVAALLPYGYRASLTAATWSDTGAGTRFRIVFANRARDEASRSAWGAPARVPAEGPARRYLEYLRRVTAQSATDTAELTRLIGYLSSETSPSKYEQPQPALASLGEFFRAAVVAEALDAGDVQTDEIRRLFANNQDQQLTPGRQRELFGRLIAAAEGRDWPLVSQRFSSIANNEPRYLLPSLAQACRRPLWSGAGKDLASKYLRLAGMYGLTDDLLATAMAKPSSPANLRNGLEAAGALLAEFVIADSVGPASYHRTQHALAQNPAAGAALLAHLCASKQGIASLHTAVEWLEPALDGVLPPFNAVFGEEVGGTKEPVGADAIDELNHRGGQLSVRFLLRAASYRERLRLVLPGLAHWLVREATRQNIVDRRYWADVAMEINPASAVEGAWLDLALLSTGNDPKSLFADKFVPQDFTRALTNGWLRMTESLQDTFQAGRAADDLLVTALIDFLGRCPWRDHKAQVSVVADLTDCLCANDARPRLKAAVLDPVQALRQLSPQATSAQIADLLVRAHANGLMAELASEALAKSGVITSGTQAAECLERLHHLISARDRAAYMWEGALAKRFADGSFGEQTAVDFAGRIVRSSQTEVTYRLHVLNIVAGSDTPAVSSALTDADADGLERSGKFLSEILKGARKRQGGLFSRRKDAKEVASDPGS